MSLLAGLARWDGKSASAIQSVYDEHAGQPEFVANLLDFLKEPELQVAASWLLKHHLESGATLTLQETQVFCRSLKKLKPWEARLHALQMLPQLEIPSRSRKQVEMMARENFEDENKFVRAWALAAFYELARQYSDYREEAIAMVEHALEHGAASLRARARNLLKRRF